MRELIEGSPSFTTLTLFMEPGEEVLTEPATMVHNSNMSLVDTKVQRNFFKVGMFGGESVFFNVWRSHGQGVLGLAGPLVGVILGFDLNPGGHFYLRHGAYMASTSNIRITTKVQRSWGGLVSGNLVMLSLKNESNTVGRFWICCYGGVIPLACSEGRVVTVHADNLIGFDPDALAYELQVQRGFRRALFSGALLSLVFRSHPGSRGIVYVHTHSLANLAEHLMRYTK